MVSVGRWRFFRNAIRRGWPAGAWPPHGALLTRATCAMWRGAKLRTPTLALPFSFALFLSFLSPKGETAIAAAHNTFVAVIRHPQSTTIQFLPPAASPWLLYAPDLALSMSERR